ncbi:MAG: type 1 glutamine amidotransferase [Acidobacteria bacterium]|nr:type 1 glutamine amidotransferase [Acidobacteriota bacterium]
MHHLTNLRIAVIATDGFEEAELTEPVRALKEAGARVDVISDKPGEIQAFRHHDKTIKVPVDKTLDDVTPESYDGLLLPGGALNADQLRLEPRVHRFVRSFQDSGKPMAAICHAPWVLISAGVARGRRMTGYHTIQDDIQNAGAAFLDREVVVDQNLITSRQPSDLPAFNREILELFSHVPAGRIGG